MEQSLRGEFFCAMMRFKKLETFFSAACDIQMNELAVLQSITGGCEACACMNLNVPDIRERLQISKPAVSYILNTLEKKRYIAREIDQRDRRKISITPTEAGITAAADCSEKFETLWLSLLEQFGETEMRDLISQLARLSEIFERMEL